MGFSSGSDAALLLVFVFEGSASETQSAFQSPGEKFESGGNDDHDASSDIAMGVFSGSI